MKVVNVNLDALTTEQTLELAKKIIAELPQDAMQELFEWLEEQL